MTLRCLEDLKDEPSLGRPAEAARPDLVADLGPDLDGGLAAGGATRRGAR